MDRGRPDKAFEYAPSGELYQGSAIRQMRQAKGIGLRQLAALIPYDSGSLSKVENNRVRVPSETLEKIATILEVDTGELADKPLHPRLSKQTTEAIEHYTTDDGKRTLEELKADVKELKADMAEVKAEVNEMNSYLREFVRSFGRQPASVIETVKSSVGQRSRKSPAITTVTNEMGGNLEGRISDLLMAAAWHSTPILDWQKGTEHNEKFFKGASAWHNEIIKVETQEEGDVRLVMNGFPSVTVPKKQYQYQVRRILENGGQAADLINRSLDYMKPCRAAFGSQVRKAPFRHIMPLGALDEYLESRFPSPDAWAGILGGDKAKLEQIAQHLRFVIRLLNKYPKYQLGLLTVDAGMTDFYKQFFWEVKGDHMLLCENFGEGEMDIRLGADDKDTIERLSRAFDDLWESGRVMTDKADVIGVLTTYAKVLEKASATS